MEIKIKLPEYKNGIEFIWEDDFNIKTSCHNNAIHISANQSGLISLARILLTLAQNEIPAGRHVHLDSYNCLEEDSIELVIEKQ